MLTPRRCAQAPTRMPLLRTLPLLAVVTTVITVGVLAWRSFQRTALTWTRVEAQTLTILRSEALTFLVTDRVVSQIVVESSEYNVILGRRACYMIATVRMYYGVDLTTLTPSNLRMEDGRVVVTVPEPRELDFSVDLGSIRFMSKRNVTVAIADWMEGRDLQADLRARLKTEALAFMASNQLIPARAAILARLNSWAPALSGALGVEVRFE